MVQDRGRTQKLLMALLVVISLIGFSQVVSAASTCENAVLYYGTCTPNGEVSIYVGNHLLKRTSCNFGLFATKVAPGGVNCLVKDFSTLWFEIDGLEVGNHTWEGKYLQFMSLRPAVTSNQPPLIKLDFNAGNNFFAREDTTCSASIKDPEGDALSFVYASVRSSSNANYTYTSQNILNSSYCVGSSSEANCSLTFDHDFPVGDVECVFQSSDTSGNLSEEVESIKLLNSAPSIHSSVQGVHSSPYGTEISIQFTGLDDDVDQLLSYSTSLGLGSLNSTSGLFKWVPTESEKGNYSFFVSVNDGIVSSRTNVDLEVKGSGVVVSVPNPPPSQPSGGSGGAGVKKSNETSSSGGGISRVSCVTRWKPEKSSLELCKGNEGKTIKQRLFSYSCPNQTIGPRNIFKSENLQCPLPVPVEISEEVIEEIPEVITPAPQKNTSIWFWLIIALIIVVVLSGIIYELQHHGVFEEGKHISSYPKPHISKGDKKQSLGDLPKVSAHIDLKRLNSKMKKADKLFNEGKIKKVKEIVDDISKEYDIMSDGDRKTFYPHYKKLYEKIRARE
jgi:hypothetical protein